MSGTIEVALLILLAATLVVAVSSRLGWPIELTLLFASLLLSLIPGLPHIQLNPELVFLLFLPPILFYAAYFTSWRDFKANTRPISLLAVGLVLFTMVVVAGVLKWLIPDMPWAIGFVLGAMVSPPDASAATAITRKLGVPRRLITIIEGESLVNDATALVAYRFAIAAAFTGIFSIHVAVIRFVFVGVGGMVVGVAVAWAGMWLLRRLEEARAQTMVSLLTAFSAYTAGELLHVSGVIATVTGGLYFGRCIPIHGNAQTRIEGKNTWDFVIFVVNIFVFTLMGLQLPSVIDHLGSYSRGQLFFYGAAISLAVLLVRIAWVFPATYIPRWLFPGLRRRDPAPRWTMVLILSWTGMRGIVSLAAAMALPEYLPSGAAFPHRNLLIYLTYVVILVTLFVPSLTLPWLLRRMGIRADDENRRDELKARIASNQEALAGLETVKGNPKYSAVEIERVQARYLRRLELLKSNMSDQAFSPLVDEDQQLRRLLRDIIKWERKALERLRTGGEIHDEIFHSLSRELDLEELRLHTPRL